MHCPNCQHILEKVQLSGVEVDHCNFCGSTLFEVNEINRITAQDAERLSLIKESDSISGGEKLSPRDGKPFQRIQNAAIPQYITLLESPTTGEVFAYPDDLLEFKKAQESKIAYFKLWHIPLPPLQEVLVFGFVALMAASVVYFSSALRQPASQNIQASTLCKGGTEQLSVGSNTLVSCLTDVPLTCKIQAQCTGGNRTLSTSTGSTTHFGQVPSDCTRFRFTCSDKGKGLNTDWEAIKHIRE